MGDIGGVTAAGRWSRVGKGGRAGTEPSVGRLPIRARLRASARRVTARIIVSGRIGVTGAVIVATEAATATMTGAADTPHTSRCSPRWRRQQHSETRHEVTWPESPTALLQHPERDGVPGSHRRGGPPPPPSRKAPQPGLTLTDPASFRNVEPSEDVADHGISIRQQLTMRHSEQPFGRCGSLHRRDEQGPGVLWGKHLPSVDVLESVSAQ
jgi:hypothetical protein